MGPGDGEEIQREGERTERGKKNFKGEEIQSGEVSLTPRVDEEIEE